NNDADAALSAAMGEFDEVAQRAITRIDAVIIRNVVTVVPAGRRLEGHQPDRCNPKPVQIIQAPQQATEIAYAVAVGIHVSADRKAVDDAVLVPEIIDHEASALIGRDNRIQRPQNKQLGFSEFTVTASR